MEQGVVAAYDVEEERHAREVEGDTHRCVDWDG
jgi:hypothetical protein